MSDERIKNNESVIRGAIREIETIKNMMVHLEKEIKELKSDYKVIPMILEAQELIGNLYASQIAELRKNRPDKCIYCGSGNLEFHHKMQGKYWWICRECGELTFKDERDEGKPICDICGEILSDAGDIEAGRHRICELSVEEKKDFYRKELKYYRENPPFCDICNEVLDNPEDLKMGRHRECQLAQQDLEYDVEEDPLYKPKAETRIKILVCNECGKEFIVGQGEYVPECTECGGKLRYKNKKPKRRKMKVFKDCGNKFYWKEKDGKWIPYHPGFKHGYCPEYKKGGL